MNTLLMDIKYGIRLLAKTPSQCNKMSYWMSINKVFMMNL